VPITLDDLQQGCGSVGKAKPYRDSNEQIAISSWPGNPKTLPLMTQIALIYADRKANLPRSHGGTEKTGPSLQVVLQHQERPTTSPVFNPR
jgi:hypothetical protein